MTSAAGDRSPVTALVLGWVIPGAGHAYAGRWGKAALFCGLIVGLLVAGFALGGGTNILPGEWWYEYWVPGWSCRGPHWCAMGGGPASSLADAIERHTASRR